ncbi:iron(III) transport system ATP-binding protein [Thiohalospira halophila DSM 15071]|uniref:Iron(III) transport system ATP-binding protein n=1 Tax=Thiohalospira halophila DSM 15071 TaxID=1123397 RepID=A0A1I1S9U3_9GAMM|nr:ABC transporter ATP-binding protein [Thiohalospira halophila]SFD43102.1 iron(III) transport system ATP-binding protein [Thiohalospira halophila DSM 15071]
MAEALRLEGLTVRYGDHTAVADVSLEMEAGTIGCLLGPSGCGKTTALRTIAGFERPDAGRVLLQGREVAGPAASIPPEHRRVGMVFQDLALFPHLSVADNIAFGLPRGAARRRERVDELLALVGLPGAGPRYPHHLSGGQQQRVAIARALAPEPAILLLDEPFSSLDVALREQLPRELRGILQAAGITALLVTHDQTEAFAMADRVGVMSGGALCQWDTPYNLYHRPATPFVADFVGLGVRLPGTVLAHGKVETELGLLEGAVPSDCPMGRQVDVLVRPDDIILDPDGQGTAQVEERVFRGADYLYTLRLPGGSRLLSLAPSHNAYAVGTRVTVRPDLDHLVLFPRDGGPACAVEEAPEDPD